MAGRLIRDSVSEWSGEKQITRQVPAAAAD
jgi:hypothetical protein